MYSTFQIWFEKGLHRVGDLSQRDYSIPSVMLQVQYSKPKSYFFTYKSAILLVGTFQNHPSVHLMSVLKLNLIKGDTCQKYKNTIQKIQCYSLQHWQEQWEEDLDTELSEKIWHRLLQLKYLTDYISLNKHQPGYILGQTQIASDAIRPQPLEATCSGLCCCWSGNCTHFGQRYSPTYSKQNKENVIVINDLINWWLTSGIWSSCLYDTQCCNCVLERVRHRKRDIIFQCCNFYEI